MTRSTTRSWRDMVLKADENFQADSQQPDAYYFGNRTFKDPKPLYGTATGTGT